MILSDIEIPADLQEVGAWVELPGTGGLAFKVRPLWNVDHRRLNDRLVEQVPRKNRLDGVLDPATADRIMNTVLVETILLDWRGLESAPGKPILFSKEKALEIISDPKYVKLRRAIVEAARDVEDRGKENLEDAAGN